MDAADRAMRSAERQRASKGGTSVKRGGRAASKTRKSQETRERIMRAASELMAEHGGIDFQMGEVSDRCHMSKGSLYYYFVDKDDLVQAIFDQAIRDTLGAIDRVVDQARTPEDALHGVCREYVTRVCSGSPVAMAMMRELTQSHGPSSSKLSGSIERIVGIIAHELELAKKDGVVRPNVDCRLAALSLCGSLTFAAVSSVGDGPSGMVDVDFSERLLDLTFSGFGVPAEERASDMGGTQLTAGQLA